MKKYLYGVFFCKIQRDLPKITRLLYIPLKIGEDIAKIQHLYAILG